MSSLVAAYAVIILVVALAVGWMLRLQYVAIERNRSLARFPARNPMPVVTLDDQGEVRYSNQAARDFVAVALGSQVSVEALVPPAIQDRFRHSLTDEGRGEIEEWVGSRTLAYNWSWLADHRIFHVYMRDVTGERIAEAELKRLAYEDSVTGLMNRNAMTEKLDELLDLPRSICLALLGIERFHMVHSSVGFDVADSLMASFARILRAKAIKQIGPGVFVARIEGAVFAIGWSHDLDKAGAIDKVKLLMDSLPPIIRDGSSLFHASYRTGVKLRTRSQAMTSGAMFNDADAALWAAETRHDARCVVHDDDIREHEQDVLVVEGKLRKAIDSGDRGLELHLQPKIDLDSGAIVGAEALLRWYDPLLGHVPPSRFIPIAEQSGLILDLGLWVRNRALEILADWRDDPHLGRLHLAINAAPGELQVDGYADRLIASLNNAGVPHDRLEIEVTERNLANMVQIVAQTAWVHCGAPELAFPLMILERATHRWLIYQTCRSARSR